MVYLPTFTIKINHSWIGKYTIVPWIRHGIYELSLTSLLHRASVGDSIMLKMIHFSNWNNAPFSMADFENMHGLGDVLIRTDG